ncbi:MAG: GTPase Era [Gemmatimonadales bacterium]|nr:GTPase Era [Gemmatimonadales bacterium]MYG48617.1 GTPase Era [Gemmatimonadales bacterium]MYK02811.1 GTPase Era [Candidatus Palauibacter ramosifaciens]
MTFRAGFVAIVGLPNVGKSTLLNAFLGERLAAVTPRAQTTQRRLLGIYSDEAAQAVFIDTPGLLEPRYTLHRSMKEEALSALEDADLVLAVADAGFAPSLEWAGGFADSIRGPKILCLNKIDRVETYRREDLRARFASGGWDGVYWTCATGGEGVPRLLEALSARLPESPPLYPVDELSDAPVRHFVAEMIRETCLEELADEVPYAVAVRIEEFRDREGGKPTYIEALIHVEKESQKGIVVGAGGRTIRKLGTRSRRKIERFLGRRVYLGLRVKVLPNWRKKTHHLRVLGFRVPAQEQ